MSEKQYKLVKCTINGEYRETMVDVRASLTDMLRNDYRLTSVKKGCEVGECGCMIGIMKKVKVPKRYITEALNLFISQNGTGSCTAHEIYCGMSEVIFMLTCEGESGGHIATMEEKLARALSLDWKEFDVPGEIKW